MKLNFNDKRFRYGTFSSAMILIVIAVLILFNLIIQKADIRIDLTPESIYSISDKTKELVSTVENDITIYNLAKTGSEDTTIKELLTQYEATSSKITIQEKDPYIYPQFTKKYSENGEEISANSLIVESGSRFKIIPAENLYDYSYDYMTGGYSKESITAESEITNAIQYVSLSKIPKIYYVTGHSEAQIPSMLKTQIEKSNYEISELNITKDGGIPEDCSILMITTPIVDYSSDEAKQIEEYLAEDGRCAVFLDFGQNFPNIENVFKNYGVSLGTELIVEGNASNYYNNPLYIMPLETSHEITQNITSDGYPIIIPGSQAIQTEDLKKSSITIEPLLTTSSSAYSKSNENSQSINKESTDKTGPFNIATAITDSYYTDTTHTTKIVVCGSSLFLRDEAIVAGNLSFALNSFNWLNDGESNIYIAPKTLLTDSVIIDQSVARNITIFTCGIIPAAIFAIGIAVWLHRRNA